MSVAADRVRLLRRELARRILVLDGAAGTMLQRRGLTEAEVRGVRFAAHPHDLRGNLDVLVLTQPDLVLALHRQYLEAGADIIETCTFNSTATSQQSYGLESLAYELNMEGARLARAAADECTKADPTRPRFVAGAIGPTTRTLPLAADASSRPPRDTAFDNLRAAYAGQIRGLVDGGCDVLLFETIVGTANLQAGLAAADAVFAELGIRLPLLCSVTTRRDGRLLSGETIDTFWAAVRDAQPLAVGVNCALGSEGLRDPIDALAQLARTAAISCYPSAGLPDVRGAHPDGPADTAAALRALADAGLVNIVGGCCGTTPDHVRAVAAAVQILPPRPFAAPAWDDV